MELKVLIDITDKTEKALQDIASAIETMDAFNSGDFAKLAKGHQITDTAQEKNAETPADPVAPVPETVLVPDPVPTAPTPVPEISKEELRAMCAKAKAGGVNVSAIIREYGHADFFKNVKPEYYGAIKAELDKQMRN